MSIETGWTDKKGNYKKYEDMDLEYLRNVMDYLGRIAVFKIGGRKLPDKLIKEFNKRLKHPRIIKRPLDKPKPKEYDLSTQEGYLMFIESLQK